MAREATPRELQLIEVARVIAENNWLSHDRPDFMAAAQALQRAGLLQDVDDPMAHDGAEPVHFVAHEEKPRDV